jgi:hypothetical protein
MSNHENLDEKIRAVTNVVGFIEVARIIENTEPKDVIYETSKLYSVLDAAKRALVENPNETSLLHFLLGILLIDVVMESNLDSILKLPSFWAQDTIFILLSLQEGNQDSNLQMAITVFYTKYMDLHLD